MALDPGSAEGYYRRGHTYYDRAALEDARDAKQWFDPAVADFTPEMAIDPMGRMRLADAYCARGSSHQQAKNYDAAIADFEKSIELGITADGCSCDPYNPLLGLYTSETRQFDKAWEIVRKARKSKPWIAPELLEKLKKDSGRNE